MEMEDRVELKFTYRGDPIRLSLNRNATLRALGEQLQILTGIEPRTMKLLLPGARPALQPFGSDHGNTILQDCAWLLQGREVRLMGSLPSELLEASRAAASDSATIGFAEEERRALQRTRPSSRGVVLPQGPYVFGAFRTLELPGVKMTPPASKALELMHTLASDRGIVAIMNKYKWHVGIMTEMAPEGYVGVSPKCLLGFNKNHGEEISLRLRTDDLKGFRMYESIKKTLLHELAHMVYSEHDDDFYRLDRKLNKEAVDFDWTKSKGQTFSKGHAYERSIDEDVHSPEQGYKLGGNVLYDAKTAASIAALRRYKAAKSEEIRSETEPDPDDNNEPDPDEESENEPYPDDKVENEPDPDDKQENEPDLDENWENPCDKNEPEMRTEPDPDEKVQAPDDRKEPEMRTEPDPDGKMQGEPDPDDNETDSQPDPDDKRKGRHETEPDPDDRMEISDDPGLERVYEAARIASSRVQKSLEKLRSEASPSEVALACQTLFTILRNIMEHPYEEKYRRIRKANALFQQRVARFQAAIELLQLVGFADEMESFILKNNDPGLLWLARSSLEAMA